MGCSAASGHDFPPDYPNNLEQTRNHLFVKPAKDADGYLELICCPTSSGCCIIEFQTGKKMFKVRVVVSHSVYKPRFDLHEVTRHGPWKHAPVGNVHKFTNHLMARPPNEREHGSFSLTQQWRANALSSNTAETRGIKSKRAAHSSTLRFHNPQNNPKTSEGANAALDIHVEADYDPKGGKEKWTETCKLTGKGMNAVGDGEEVRMWIFGKLVAAARRGTYEHKDRGHHLQPFLGLQISKELNQAETFLMILLCLGWCEESVHTPDDNREEFMEVLRGIHKVEIDSEKMAR